MQEKNYFVYKHTSPSGKVYIGITKNIRHRWRGNGRGYIGSNRIYYAILKYGWENFKHEILYSGLTKAEAEQKEIELIKQNNSTDERYGYNLQQGGKIRTLNEKSRIKLSNSLKGHKVDMEHIRRLALQKSKPVVCIETGIEYKSIQAAADSVGVLRTTISKAVRGVTETAGGYHWAYKGFENKVAIKKRTYWNEKKVLCIDTGEIYNSVSEAGRVTGIHRKSIANNCNGITKTAGGYAWCYIS